MPKRIGYTATAKAELNVLKLQRAKRARKQSHATPEVASVTGSFSSKKGEGTFSRDDRTGKTGVHVKKRTTKK